jgi:hypothetical protein
VAAVLTAAVVVQGVPAVMAANLAAAVAAVVLALVRLGLVEPVALGKSGSSVGNHWSIINNK